MRTACDAAIDWLKVRDVFDLAVELPSDERARRVSEMCGDDSRLRAAVEQLLAAQESVGERFLESHVVRGAPSRLDGLAAGTASRVRYPAGSRISHYRIDAFIGAGGMGSVYRAYDVALRRPAALKLLPAQVSPLLQQRLRAEADTCAHLQHPNIATYYESGGSAAGSFIAMELVEGETLRAALNHGALPAEQAVAVACCLLEALSHAHSRGILHCDVKPENVMVTGARSAKLLDFGLAQCFVSNPSPESVAEERTTDQVFGTMGYLSPEQLANACLDERSDLFQVGAVLYEMLAGRPAFPGETALGRISAVLTRTPAPLPAPVATALSTVVFRALERGRSRRYATAAEFLADLRDVNGGRARPN